MTKAELLTALGNKFEYISSEEEISDDKLTAVGLKRFRVYYWDVEGDAVKSGEITFFTNSDETQAWWFNSDPKPTPTESFATKLDNYIQSKIDDDTVQSAVIESTYKENARVRFLVSGTEKVGYVFDDGTGTLTHTVIT